jgi:hypothetical protein
MGSNCRTRKHTFRTLSWPPSALGTEEEPDFWASVRRTVIQEAVVGGFRGCYARRPKVGDTERAHETGEL